jgi:putative FmdB family regulatory protein
VPTYDYQCRACGTTYEVIHSMLEDGPTTCERCGGQLRRVLYPSGIIFKGSGFYKTDSRSGSSSSARRSSGSAPASKEAGSGSDATTSSDKPAATGGTEAASPPKKAD